MRLFFSEPVEVGFGAVRVFDVDAHRVDLGHIQRAGGNREVVVPVRHLADGTYTVTWRVVSADGHPVHGGFGFYVVAPSTISAVAVPGEQGGGAGRGLGLRRRPLPLVRGLLRPGRRRRRASLGVDACHIG